MLWKVRGKRKIVSGADVWRGFLWRGSSLLRCFSRWDLGIRWLCQVEGTAKVRWEKLGCYLGIIQRKKLDVEVDGYRREFGGPVHQTLLLTTWGQVGFGHEDTWDSASLCPPPWPHRASWEHHSIIVRFTQHLSQNLLEPVGHSSCLGVL